MRGRERLADSIYVERYIAVTKYLIEQADATIAYACQRLNIPLNSYYKGKELVDKGVVIVRDKQETTYIELTEPVFYLGSWFIPQLTYPITPRQRN
jgi:ACT domain-containing protein